MDIGGSKPQMIRIMESDVTEGEGASKESMDILKYLDPEVIQLAREEITATKLAMDNSDEDKGDECGDTSRKSMCSDRASPLCLSGGGEIPTKWVDFKQRGATGRFSNVGLGITGNRYAWKGGAREIGENSLKLTRVVR